MSTRARSCSQSWSSPLGHLAKEAPKPSILILEALHSKAKNITKTPPDLFAQVAAQSPSQNASISAPAELTPTELAIASTTSVLMMAVKKHQSNILSLLMSVALGVSIFDSKIKQLRADNIALMTSATIQVQQARGVCFSLGRLYKIVCLEEKEARRVFNKAPAPGSLATIPNDTTMVMSSVTDSDGYTTMSNHGGSITFSPKLCPQSRSPLCSSNGDGTRRNHFDDTFFMTFLPTSLDNPADRTAPPEVVAAILKKPTPRIAGMKMKFGIVLTSSALFADWKKTYEEPALHVSAAEIFPALSAIELCDYSVADGPANRTTPTKVAVAILTKPTPRFARMKAKLGVVLTAGMLSFADGKKLMRNQSRKRCRFFLALSAKELSHSAMVQKVNVGVSIGLTVPALGSDGMRVYDVATDLGAKNAINKSLSPSFVSPSEIELDLDVYVNDPASCQLTKKALCGDQMLLVSATWSTSTSASP
jgi:hypothetical protein